MNIEAAKNPKRGAHQRLECLYNSMLWPVKNFTAKGFLWYQGESNISNYQFYAPMMTKVDYADKKAIVTFDNAPAGLFPTFSELEGFEIAGADNCYVKENTGSMRFVSL